MQLARSLLAVSLLTVAATASPAPVQLSVDGTAASDIYTIVTPQESPDGKWFVYVHDPVTNDADELYSVARNGGAPIRLSASLPTGFHVQWIGISGDSTRVVYLVNQETPAKLELWSVPIGGPATDSIKISPSLPSFGSVFAGTIPPIMSPDGMHVVYFTDTTTDGVAEVWSSPVDGSSPAVRLSPDPVTGGGAYYLQATPLKISADSSRVVFLGDFQFDEQVDLWSAPIDGSAAAVRLSFTVDHLAADVSSFALTPDGTQVLFLHDRAIDERVELFRTGVDGIGGAQLSPVSTTAPTSAGDVTTFVIAPDSSRVLFRADLQVDGRFDLWSVPLSGSSAQAVIVSPALVAGREVTKLAFAPDSSRVAFLVDEASNNVYDLWSAKADGSSPAVRLNPVIVSSADVVDFAFTSDGGRIVYEVRDTAPEPDVSRLWTVPASGPFTGAAELTSTALLAASIDQWVVTANDDVVMLGALVDANDRELYRVHADGAAPRQTLASSMASSAIDPFLLRLTASGEYVIFATTTSQGRRLLDVLVDASAAASALDIFPPNATSGVISTLVWPTRVGDGILFVGDYKVDDRYDLWLFDHPPARIFADGFEP